MSARKRRAQRTPAPVPAADANPRRARADRPRARRARDRARALARPARAGPAAARRPPPAGAPDRARARRRRRRSPGAPRREVGLVFATVLVGQAILGWHNDLVDRTRDRGRRAPAQAGRRRAARPGHGVVRARLRACCSSYRCRWPTALIAGSAYLLALLVGLLGNVLLRTRLAVLAALGGVVRASTRRSSRTAAGAATALGDPPEIAVTVLAGALGVCVHVLRALPGLVADNRDGSAHLPLRIALRIGAPRLLCLTIAVTRAGRRRPGRGRDAGRARQ